MSVILNCWDNIIGLSQSECDCHSLCRPADYNYSQSGLFIGDQEPLNNIEGLQDCDNDCFWEIMEKARDNAVRQFQSDTLALLLKDYKIKRAPYYGGIGYLKNSQDINISTTYAGIRICCADIISGTLTIKNIGTLFNFTGTVTVTIYNNKNEIVGTTVLNTVANKHTQNNYILQLPLHDDYLDHLEYNIVYSLTGTQAPRNNTVHCNCGAIRPNYDMCNPNFYKSYPKKYKWANWIIVGGFLKNDLDFQNVACNTSLNMYGLTIDVELRCNVNELLCMDELDFTSDPLAASMAHAILYKASWITANKILKTDLLNRQTIVNREQLEDSQKEWNQKYNEITRYIADNVDISKNDCFACKEKQQIQKLGIMA